MFAEQRVTRWLAHAVTNGTELEEERFELREGFGPHNIKNNYAVSSVGLRNKF